MREETGLIKANSDKIIKPTFDHAITNNQIYNSILIKEFNLKSKLPKIYHSSECKQLHINVLD